jgi:cellulose synthase/poly-beta-1,6-N-acetylglucosamine synthase-like glycosyltransferase
MAVSNQSQTALSSELQQPLVSVLIPSYNRPGYLKEAIESAVGQTYQNVEILVFDDCSPENPQKLVGINLLRAKKPEDARPYLWKALSQHSSLRTLVALILSFMPPSLASRF